VSSGVIARPAGVLIRNSTIGVPVSQPDRSVTLDYVFGTRQGGGRKAIVTMLRASIGGASLNRALLRAEN
jgi:hypothetical protein